MWARRNTPAQGSHSCHNQRSVRRRPTCGPTSAKQPKPLWFGMAKLTRSRSVPKVMQATYYAITALTDTCCREHLNEEYLELAQDMAVALCRKRPSPVASGQPRTWTCGTIYVLGQINFPSDKSFGPSMAMADVCVRFGVGQSAANAKAQVISRALAHRAEKWIRFSRPNDAQSREGASELTPKVQVHFWVRCSRRSSAKSEIVATEPAGAERADLDGRG